jgi:hypothetical protein
MSRFCLIHRSRRSPSGWGRLVPELEKRRHEVVCANPPTTSLAQRDMQRSLRIHRERSMTLPSL